ncbi:plasmid stabilization protein [Brevundimonas sp.]|uniref:plasmid stabilization protein n=1 Tax=Brevundimonas sp. TaxID=1871086 RepID=UPI003A938191
MHTLDHTRRTVLLAATATAAAVALPAIAAARTHTIIIDKMKFGPSPAGLRVGDTVVWVNRDALRHTATARNDSFDVDLVSGASGRTLLRAAGTIPYICRFHPGMTGVLNVAA